MVRGSDRGRTSTGQRRVLGPRTRLLLGAGILVAILLFVRYRLDWRGVVAVLERADLTLLLAGVLVAVVGLVGWSESMRHLLPTDGADLSRRRGFLVYATGLLVRNVIPLGFASSIAVLGYVYRREATVPFDRALATVSVAELVSAVVSTGLAVVGVLLLVFGGAPPALAAWLGGGVVVVLVGGTLVTATVWYRRDAVERLVQWVASALAGVADDLRRNDRGTTAPASVRAAVERYVDSLSVVSGQRRSVALALGYTVLAWGSLVVALVVSGLAVGYHVPLPVAMVVVTLGGYATVLPVPGGLGGYELGVAGAISLLAGADVVTALAVTLVFRLCTYWFVVLVGVVASVALSVDLKRLAATAVATDRGEAGSADR